MNERAQEASGVRERRRLGATERGAKSVLGFTLFVVLPFLVALITIGARVIRVGRLASEGGNIRFDPLPAMIHRSQSPGCRRSRLNAAGRRPAASLASFGELPLVRFAHGAVG